MKPAQAGGGRVPVYAAWVPLTGPLIETAR